MIAAIGLAVFGTALYVESFVHTDDGCRVEIHCLACRLAVVSAGGTPVSAPIVTPPAAVAERLVLPPDRDPLGLSARSTPARAPPLA
jgi:hypothetical protein